MAKASVFGAPGIKAMGQGCLLQILRRKKTL
jgi:hypothetical protein